MEGLFFRILRYYIFLERCKFQACPSHLLRNFSGIFVRMGVHVCVCVRGGAGREKESTGYKQTFKGRLETRKACVCCVLEISGFETTTIQTCTSLSWTLCCRFLDQKASLITKSYIS